MVDLLNKWISNWHIGLQIAMFVVGLALGVFCLVKFCDMFVDSSSAIAKKLKISPLIIGLTVVAMGTSLPELAVSVSASIDAIGGGYADMAIGNVVGSNIANILLVLGFSVVFTPIVVKKSVCKREMPILLGVTALMVLFVCLFSLTEPVGDFAITRWEGIILTVLIFVYIGYLVFMAKRHPEELDQAEDVKDMPWWKAILFVVLGAAGIILGGQFVVFGAQGIAIHGAVALGADENMTTSLVSLTIVAVGTSLPELVTSTIAAKKGQNELALGNVIGSNIFNILFVLGLAATVNPLTTGTGNQILVDVFVMLGVTAMLFVFSLSGKLRKAHGWVLLGCYLAYLTYLIVRTVI